MGLRMDKLVQGLRVASSGEEMFCTIGADFGRKK